MTVARGGMYNVRLHPAAAVAGRSFNGRTRGSGPWNRGSNPCLPAISQPPASRWPGGRSSVTNGLAPVRARIPPIFGLCGGGEAGPRSRTGSRPFGLESPHLRALRWRGGRASVTNGLAPVRARIPPIFGLCGGGEAGPRSRTGSRPFGLESPVFGLRGGRGATASVTNGLAPVRARIPPVFGLRGGRGATASVTNGLAPVWARVPSSWGSRLRGGRSRTGRRAAGVESCRLSASGSPISREG